MNASPQPAATDDEMTRAYRAFQAAQRRYFARPTVRNWEAFNRARAEFLKAWGADDAA